MFEVVLRSGLFITNGLWFKEVRCGISTPLLNEYLKPSWSECHIVCLVKNLLKNPVGKI